VCIDTLLHSLATAPEISVKPNLSSPELGNPSVKPNIANATNDVKPESAVPGGNEPENPVGPSLGTHHPAFPFFPWAPGY
jgi:hypothetical protein